MASVTVTFGGELVGEFPVDKPVVVVGREATCEIHIDNLGVSRTHCQFIKRGNAYVLQDMNSANGTYVNGKRVGEHYLNDGDEILIGKHTMKYSAHGQVASEQAGQAAAAGDEIQDALHTYVMDGSKIRERLAGMHGAGEEGAGAAQQTPKPGTAKLNAIPTPGGPMTAADHALDFDPLKPQRRKTVPTTRPIPAPSAGGMGGGLKVLLYLSLGMNAVLIVLLILIISLLMKMSPQGSFIGGPAPSQAPAAESTETPPATP